MATKDKREDLDRTLLPDGQQRDHLVLPSDALAQEKKRPVRSTYRHEKCGTTTRMPSVCAETYAVDPTFYDSTFCSACGAYFPVGPQGEFVWLDDGTKVGT